jgi:hypothetical protein
VRFMGTKAALRFDRKQSSEKFRLGNDDSNESISQIFQTCSENLNGCSEKVIRGSSIVRKTTVSEWESTRSLNEITPNIQKRVSS